MSNNEYDNQSQGYSKQDAQYENDYLSGKTMGIASLVCAILGLGSFGALDVIALLLSHFGKKKLKNVPKDYPGRDFAMSLNRWGFIVSGGLLIVGIILFILVVPMGLLSVSFF